MTDKVSITLNGVQINSEYAEHRRRYELLGDTSLLSPG